MLINPAIDYSFYGDGSDGDVTLVATTTLTRDMVYRSLATAAFELRGEGFRVFARERLTV